MNLQTVNSFAKTPNGVLTAPCMVNSEIFSCVLYMTVQCTMYSFQNLKKECPRAILAVARKIAHLMY